jgi:hypothetical protein
MNRLFEQKLENEGRILTISNDRQDDCLQVYWNGDTPEYSKVVAKNEEIFIHLASVRNYKNHRSSIAISPTEAKVLRDTLDYMIKKLDE